MFALAGLLWASATILVRRWRIPPLHVAALVACLSSAIYLPLYLLTKGSAAIAGASTSVVLIEIVVQGLLAGIVAVFAFSRSVELLGASRAAVFPALVPAAAIIIGIPLTGELPTTQQVVGLAIVSFGLVFATGMVLPRFFRRTAA
jgi:drug/metabolite transporter (DMT)-like permease